MAGVNHARVDGNNSANCCLILTIMVFVASCFIGAWMTMSSSNGSIRTGVSYEDWMGGMPEVGTSFGDLSYDTQKQSSSQDVVNPDMQGNENARPQSPSFNENQKLEPKDEKGSPEKAKLAGETETGVEGSHQNVKPVEKEIDQSRNSSQEQSISSSMDRPQMPNQTSVAVVTQPAQSQSSESGKRKDVQKLPSSQVQTSHRWKVCNVTAGPDYIPCLDNIQGIKKIHFTGHFEHRERHCPDSPPTCLVSLPKGYRIPIKWPKSRDMIWFANAPHTKLVDYKRPQNWVKVTGQYLTFPGGGTQFKHGALHYIDFIQKTVPDISWGKRSRVILDVGCGVASFGGYLFERDVITMSMAPKDEHEAQVQFALERGIPAILAVMGTQRLPFPALAFDVVHCARCRVYWHKDGGRLLLELDRVLRPGGYFVWSATPVYRRGAEDVAIWKAMSKLTKSMCWDLVKIGKDEVNGVSAAMYKKPTSNECYETRQASDPPICDESDDPNAAWYTLLQTCIHKVPTGQSVRGSLWPPHWPSRLEKPPYWLENSEVGASKKFLDDSNFWKQVLANSYLTGIGIDWSSVRNVMDMRASYGGFAAALKDLDVWVMNVVPVNSSADTLPVIYERGLLGIYHDWCESFNTYPRSYDLLHADHLFSDLKKRCNFVAVMAEVDRILRPGAWLIVRDDAETISEVESLATSLQWKINFSYSGDNNQGFGLLCVEKTTWRPSQVETIISAIA